VSRPAATVATLPLDRLLTAEELAGRWQVPKAQVYRLTRECGLPTVHIGRYCRYRMAAVEAWELEGGVSG
jgi:excisionase family DNA binding protein